MLRLFLFFLLERRDIVGSVGRPKKDKCRSRFITIRLTDDELKELDKMSFEKGLSRTEIVLQGIRMSLNLMKFKSD